MGRARDGEKESEKRSRAEAGGRVRVARRGEGKGGGGRKDVAFGTQARDAEASGVVVIRGPGAAGVRVQGERER